VSAPVKREEPDTARAATVWPVLLLLVESSPQDAETTRRAFVSTGVADTCIVHCATAEEAIDFLERRGPRLERTGALLPRLMILGLDTPGLDGEDMLRRLRTSDHWRAMPVVVLASSARVTDVESYYRLGANGYLVKPRSREALVELVEKTKRYWFDTVLTPPVRR